MFLSQAPSGGEQVPGPFLILAQGKRPQHNLCFLPIGNVLATSLSWKEKAERARERCEEIKKKGKSNEMFPFLIHLLLSDATAAVPLLPL